MILNMNLPNKMGLNSDGLLLQNGLLEMNKDR